ncbi:MAG TPA: hypothetical protein VMZ31_15295 [Phycisphaerae bacterium]|nr:hypothetical protein [Phycisphaerae bacterium]
MTQFRTWARVACASVACSGVLVGCGESAQDRSTAAFQLGEARKLLEIVRSRFEQGMVRGGANDVIFDNASSYVNAEIRAIVGKRVPDADKRGQLAALSDELAQTFNEKVAAKVDVAEPDFQAGLAGLDECVSILDRMEAVINK